MTSMSTPVCSDTILNSTELFHASKHEIVQCYSKYSPQKKTRYCSAQPMTPEVFSLFVGNSFFHSGKKFSHAVKMDPRKVTFDLGGKEKKSHTVIGPDCTAGSSTIHSRFLHRCICGSCSLRWSAWSWWNDLGGKCSALSFCKALRISLWKEQDSHSEKGNVVLLSHN